MCNYHGKHRQPWYHHCHLQIQNDHQLCDRITKGSVSCTEAPQGSPTIRRHHPWHRRKSWTCRLILHGPDVPTSTDNQSLVTIWIGTVSYTSSNDLTKHSNQLLCQKTFWMLPISPPKKSKTWATKHTARHLFACAECFTAAPGSVQRNTIIITYIPSIWLHLGHTSAASLRQLSKLLRATKPEAIILHWISITYWCDWTPSFHRDFTHLHSLGHDIWRSSLWSFNQRFVAQEAASESGSSSLYSLRDQKLQEPPMSPMSPAAVSGAELHGLVPKEFPPAMALCVLHFLPKHRLQARALKNG